MPESCFNPTTTTELRDCMATAIVRTWSIPAIAPLPDADYCGFAEGFLVESFGRKWKVSITEVTE